MSVEKSAWIQTHCILAGDVGYSAGLHGLMEAYVGRKGMLWRKSRMA